ncbi:hypothetical protein Hte_009630 [Hypoxylon texense]
MANMTSNFTTLMSAADVAKALKECNDTLSLQRQKADKIQQGARDKAAKLQYLNLQTDIMDAARKVETFGKELSDLFAEMDRLEMDIQGLCPKDRRITDEQSAFTPERVKKMEDEVTAPLLGCLVAVAGSLEPIRRLGDHHRIELFKLENSLLEEDLTNTKRQHQEALAELQANLDKERVESNLHTQLEKLQEEFEREKERHNKSYRKLADKKAELDADLRNLRKEVAEVRADASSKDKKIELAQKHIAKHDRNEKILTAEHSSIKSGLKASIEALHQIISQKDIKITEHENTIRAHEQKAEAYEGQIEGLKRLRQDQSQAGHEAEEDAREIIGDLQNQLRLRDDRIRISERQVEQRMDEVHTLKGQLARSQSETQKLEAASHEFEKKYQRKVKYANTYKEKLERLRGNYDVLKESSDRMQEERDKAVKDKDEGENEYDRLRTEWLFCKKESEDFKRESEAKLVRREAKWKDETRKLAAELDEERLGHRQAASELDEARRELEREAEVNGNLRRANQTQSSDMEDLRSRLGAAQEESRTTREAAETAASNLDMVAADLRQERLAIARYFAAESHVQTVDDEVWLEFAKAQRESAVAEAGQQAGARPWIVSQVWLPAGGPPAVAIPEALDVSTLVVRLYGDVTTRPRSNQSLYLLGALTERLAIEPRARPSSLVQLLRRIVETQPDLGDEVRNPVEAAFVLALWRLARLLRARWGLDVEESMGRLQDLESSSFLSPIRDLMRDGDDEEVSRALEAEPYVWLEESIVVKKLEGGWRVVARLRDRCLLIVHGSRLELSSLDYGVINAPEGLNPIQFSLLGPQRTKNWLLCMSD